MPQHLGAISLVVRDYDEAISYYTTSLGFDLIEDTQLTDTKRWVIVAPPGSRETRILLAQAASPDQTEHIGNQTGGRVFLLLNTDDFWRDYNRMQTNGVHFTEQPRHEPYGTVVVFRDLYGNLWDLVQLQQPDRPAGLAAMPPVR